MTIFKVSVAALALIATGVGSASAREEAPALIVKEGIGKVAVDDVEMSFNMGKPSNPKDDESFTSVRDTSVYDDRGTFLAAVETLERRCRSYMHPMNVDLDKFKKLKAVWLKNRATAANYRKASKQFKSIRIRPIEDQTADDYEWQGVCDNVNEYVMQLKIFKHLPDAEWSKYEAEAPAWMRSEVSGTYPYIDQVKFTAYTSGMMVYRWCKSAPEMKEENWRVIRDSRLNFKVNRANAQQTKDIEHYAALIDQAKQRIEWNQARAGDIARLARVCSEYGAMVSYANEKAVPMDDIASLFLVGVALRNVQCSAGARVVRNALEFARQYGKTEDDVWTFAMANKGDQLRVLTASVDASRAGAMDRTLSLFCQAAIDSPRFLGLPNPQ